MKVLGIVGSLRRESLNRKLLAAAGELLPDGVDLRIWEGLRLVPPFDEDQEAGRAPESVAELRRLLAGADVVLFATPEYNSSIPGQLKNALDWVSRPDGRSALRSKPAAVVGASTGPFGAAWAQAELRQVLARIGARVVARELAVRHAHEAFDDEGRLRDENVRTGLGEVLDALLDEARTQELVAA